MGVLSLIVCLCGFMCVCVCVYVCVCVCLCLCLSRYVLITLYECIQMVVFMQVSFIYASVCGCMCMNINMPCEGNAQCQSPLSLSQHMLIMTSAC